MPSASASMRLTSCRLKTVLLAVSATMKFHFSSLGCGNSGAYASTDVPPRGAAASARDGSKWHARSVGIASIGTRRSQEHIIIKPMPGPRAAHLEMCAMLV